MSNARLAALPVHLRRLKEELYPACSSLTRRHALVVSFVSGRAVRAGGGASKNARLARELVDNKRRSQTDLAEPMAFGNTMSGHPAYLFFVRYVVHDDIVRRRNGHLCHIAAKAI